MKALKVILPLAGFILGVLIVYPLAPEGVPLPAAEYLSLALLAGVDAICGGVRAGLQGRFRSDIFLSGFTVTMVVAVAFVFFGNLLAVDLHLAAVVVLGGRIFLNLSLIRRELLDRRLAAGGEEDLEERARRGSRERYEAVLAQVPDVEPDERDALQ